MRQIFWRQKSKILVVALAATLGVGGLTIEARAFQINTGDLVLAVYGNGTEYYRDLGQASALLVPGTQTTIDLSTSTLNPMGVVGGAIPVTWTLARNTFAPPAVTGATTFVNFASQANSQGIADSGNILAVSNINGNVRSWQGLLSTVSAPLGNEVLLNASDPASFTSVMGTGSNFSGAYTGSGLEGGLGSLLTVIQGRVSGNLLSDVGRAVLLANGQLQICGGANCTPTAVPLPAAAVLFGTGLIGLAGVARRKLVSLNAWVMRPQQDSTHQS